MADFKFALRCWGVLRQRTYTWRKCSKEFQVAVCRYGRKPKPHSRRAQNLFQQTTSERPIPQNGFAGVEAQRECITDEALANPCGWRVRGKVTGDETVIITVCELVHSCPGHLHSWRASATARWLSDVLGNQVVNNTSITVPQLQDVFRNEYGRQSTYMAAWRSKEIIMDHIQGSESSSFQVIPAFCDALKSLDRGAYAEWETYPGTRKFWRVFVCPTALGRAFPHLRPHVGLDACHTKNHKYPMQVLLATAMDGNNHVNYLAYALVDRENEENWSLFLRLVRRAVVGVEDTSVQFVSDRCKGIVNAVRDVFPGQSHTHCTIHLERNLKRFGKNMVKLFQGLYRQRTEERFKEVLQRISATNKECGDYIASIAPNTYAAYAVPQPRFGHTTSNLVEVGNSCILPLRSYAPFKLCFQMYIYLMELKAKRQRQASAMESRFTPFATDLLQKNEEAAGAYRVRMASANQALVQSNRQDFIVTTFPDVSCSCLGFKDMLLPCIHILAVERESRRNSDRLVDRVWTVDALCAAHTLTLPPILAQELKQDLHCMAPPAAVKKGRRRVRRIPGPGECSQNALRNSHQSSREESSLISVPVNDTSTNLEGLLQEPPIKKARLCSLCRGSGHDRRNCHSKQVSLPPVEADIVQTQDTAGPPNCTPEEGFMGHFLALRSAGSSHFSFVTVLLLCCHRGYVAREGKVGRKRERDRFPVAIPDKS
ncbi:hypothetical protein R1sor_002039 [Riccia sorocarpa]|uniref:SWIM-type domain-containing protein n=1 Tax=Riccia sorocarpa TaxID=122646 RepID=A0ABD3GXM6_9MARC